MCDPITLLAAGVVMSAAAGGYGAVTSKQTADFNAASMENQAEQTRLNAAEQERRFRRDADHQAAAVEAAQAGSGVETTTGSPLLTADRVAKNLELDARTIGFGGQLQSNNLMAQSRATKAAGNSAFVSDLVGVGSSLLTGGAQLSIMNKRLNAPAAG